VFFFVFTFSFIIFFFPFFSIHIARTVKKWHEPLFYDIMSAKEKEATPQAAFTFPAPLLFTGNLQTVTYLAI